MRGKRKGSPHSKISLAPSYLPKSRGHSSVQLQRTGLESDPESATTKAPQLSLFSSVDLCSSICIGKGLFEHSTLFSNVILLRTMHIPKLMLILLRQTAVVSRSLTQYTSQPLGSPWALPWTLGFLQNPWFCFFPNARES